MPLTKVLWAALSGSLGVIVLMAAAWASEVKSSTSSLEQRLSVVEQHYSAIQADLQDLREHVKEIKEMLRQGR
jgi:septation ring formation regulator EzrA